MKKISLVVSAYNEEQGLREFYRVTSGILRDFCDRSRNAGPDKESYSYGIFFVNDGSSDGTAAILAGFRKLDPEHVSVISFSRNFGHEAAMCAGLDYADGDYLIFMDADLQHPPAEIPKIMEAFENGAEVISMARTKNEDAGKIKNITSGMYYALMNKISSVHLEPNASDFFALSEAPAQVLRENYRDKIRFLRGYVQNIGFRKAVLEYEAAPRVAGESHYSLKKLFRLFVSTVICFSDLPLKAGIYAGILSAVLGLVLIVYTLLTRSGAPGGYATIVIALCFFFAVLFLILGVIGEYISVIYTEMKDRPVYIVRNIETAGTAGGTAVSLPETDPEDTPSGEGHTGK